MNYFILGELLNQNRAERATLLVLDLHRLVLGEVAIDHLAAKSLRGLLLEGLADEELVPHLLEPLVLEVVAKVKQFDNAVFEAHDDVSVEWNDACFILLELDVVLAALRSQIYVGYLSCTKWLYLIADDVEPEELHFYLWIVCGFPNHNLAALVQGQKNGGAEVLAFVLTLVVLKLD